LLTRILSSDLRASRILKSPVYKRNISILDVRLFLRDVCIMHGTVVSLLGCAYNDRMNKTFPIQAREGDVLCCFRPIYEEFVLRGGRIVISKILVSSVYIR
jgi:hypothetical protein